MNGEQEWLGTPQEQTAANEWLLLQMAVVGWVWFNHCMI